MCKYSDLTWMNLYYISEVLKQSIRAEVSGKNVIFDHQLTPVVFFWDKILPVTIVQKLDVGILNLEFPNSFFNF